MCGGTSCMDDLLSLLIFAWSGSTRFMMRLMLAMGSRRSWSRMASDSPDAPPPPPAAPPLPDSLIARAPMQERGEEERRGEWGGAVGRCARRELAMRCVTSRSSQLSVASLVCGCAAAQRVVEGGGDGAEADGDGAEWPVDGAWPCGAARPLVGRRTVELSSEKVQCRDWTVSAERSEQRSPPLCPLHSQPHQPTAEASVTRRLQVHHLASPASSICHQLHRLPEWSPLACVDISSSMLSDSHLAC